MKKKATTKFLFVMVMVLALTSFSCKIKKERGMTLFNAHCSSCHRLPAIEDLPKHIWKDQVLPDMAARMGLIDDTNDPYYRISQTEKLAIMESGIYPTEPTITPEDWDVLEGYILYMAHVSFVNGKNVKGISALHQFSPKSINLNTKGGSVITFLKYDSVLKNVITANLNGVITKYDARDHKVTDKIRTANALTDYSERDTLIFTTAVGRLNPSQVPSGALKVSNSSGIIYSSDAPLHRPVHTLVHDFDKDGNDEIVVCEFGDLTGKLSLFRHQGDYKYERKVLLNLPGSIRTIARDMDQDGKMDIVLLTSQGREGIHIFYQGENLNFSMETPIKFSPVYGSSWFEILDFNKDGFDDIVTVHGDNADKSYVHKPYHGLRLHINDGTNNFKETYFYPMNGATRVVANDFDQDGDIDFGLLSTFPNYELNPVYSFVYLENKNPEKFLFEPYGLDSSKLGRWLLMDVGDADSDGDMDIILSAFSYSFTPVPEKLEQAWRKSQVDLLILENTLKP